MIHPRHRRRIRSKKRKPLGSASGFGGTLAAEATWQVGHRFGIYSTVGSNRQRMVYPEAVIHTSARHAWGPAVLLQ